VTFGSDADQWRMPEPPVDVDRPYLRLLRNSTYRWWKPLVGLGLFFWTYLSVIAVLVIVPGVAYVAVNKNIDFLNDQGSPLVFLITNLSLAALIPCAMFPVWAVHRMDPRFLISVTRGFRWNWFWRCVGISTAVVVGTYVLASVLPVGGESSAGASRSSVGTFVGLALVVVLTTPLQAAGEEFAFRGYLGQAIGAWVKFPAVSIVITSLLFALAHGGQSAPLFLDRFAFGLVAGFLVMRTGGLEISIALHTVNNFVALLAAAAYSNFSEQLTSPDAPWSLVLIDLVQLTIFVVVAEAMRKRWMSQGLLQVSGGASSRPEGL